MIMKFNYRKWMWLLKLITTILTAIITTLGVESCIRFGP